MTRALLWLLPAAVLFLVVVLLLAPSGAGGQAAALGAIAIVPAALVAGAVGLVGRGRRVRTGADDAHATEDR